MARNNGSEFEQSFAGLMKRRLGVRHTKLNQKFKGKVAVDPFECDIRGEAYSPVLDVIKHAAVVVFVFGMAMMVTPWFWPDAPVVRSLQRVIDGAATAISPALAGHFGLLALATVAWVVGVLATTYTRKEIWVECRDRKAPVTRNDVFTLHGRVDDVRGAPEKECDPQEIWFASRSRFTQDAVNFAKERRIRCFFVTGDQIQEL